MVFVSACIMCGKETPFHDDEAENEEMLLCPDCYGKWQEVKLVNDIMSGAFDPPVPEHLKEIFEGMEEEVNEDEGEDEPK